jgi:hypothetical protein
MALVARALLFDVDQTLLYTGGAGSKAMTLAFQDLFGIAGGLAGVEFAGRTDVVIFRDGLARQGLGAGPAGGRGAGLGHRQLSSGR